MAEVIVAFSDCLLISESGLEEWKKISYSNKIDFAGIAYTGLDLTFETRVNARFFRERFPDETESEDLSDGSSVVLSSTLKTQKQLEVELAPAYEHHMLKLILQHNKVTIDDEDWSKGEAYEMEYVDNRNPFAKGSVWLTKKYSEVFSNVFDE